MHILFACIYSVIWIICAGRWSMKKCDMGWPSKYGVGWAMESAYKNAHLHGRAV